jgi:chromosome segregation ATPase
MSLLLALTGIDEVIEIPVEVSAEEATYSTKAKNLHRAWKARQEALRKQAKVIIKKIQQPQADIAELHDEASDVIKAMQASIDAVDAEIAQVNQDNLSLNRAINDRQQIYDLRIKLIDMQLQSELMQQQIEEIDVVFITFMLVANAG